MQEVKADTPKASAKLSAAASSTSAKIAALILITILSWSAILAVIGISRVGIEVENYITSQVAPLENALAEGDLISIQKILWKLSDYGIDGVKFTTNIFWTNEKRIVHFGQLQKSHLTWTKNLAITRNGLTLGRLTYRPAIIQVALRSLISQWPLLLILILINIIVVIATNAIFIGEIKKFEASLMQIIGSNGSALNISEANAKIQGAESQSQSPQSSNFFVPTSLNAALRHLIAKMNELHVAKSKIAQAEAVHSLARQVAHDIRSPLSALNIASAKIASSTSNQEILALMKAAIVRINSIADDLLARKTKQRPQPESQSESQTDSVSCCHSIDIIKICQDARAEVSTKYPKVAIEFAAQNNLPESQFAIDKNNFQRALTNLLNNAVEAINHDHGIVQMDLRTISSNSSDTTTSANATNSASGVSLQISDNGVGMPAHILSQLGQQNFSYNKPGGNGLGLAHAFQTLESCGGKIDISSSLAAGTRVMIKLMAAQEAKDLVAKNDF